MRHTTLLGAVLVLATLASCGGGAGPTASPLSTTAGTPAPSINATGIVPPSLRSSAAPSLDPGTSITSDNMCALLTTPEVAAAAREQVADGVAESGSCTWIAAANSGTTTVLIEDISRTDFEDSKSVTIEGVTNTPEPGIGDDAFLQAVGNSTTSLFARKGDKAIQVTLVAFDWKPADLEAAERQLATLAIGRR